MNIDEALKRIEELEERVGKLEADQLVSAIAQAPSNDTGWKPLIIIPYALGVNQYQARGLSEEQAGGAGQH